MAHGPVEVGERTLVVNGDGVAQVTDGQAVRLDVVLQRTPVIMKHMI